MGDDDLTKNQERIIQAAKSNKDATNKEIAEKADVSPSYVSQVLNEHGDPRESSGVGLVGWLIILGIIGAIILAATQGDGESAESAATLFM